MVGPTMSHLRIPNKAHTASSYIAKQHVHGVSALLGTSCYPVCTYASGIK